MVNEIWTSIESFENHYEVSNYGRVRSYKNNKNGLTPNFVAVFVPTIPSGVKLFFL